MTALNQNEKRYIVMKAVKETAEEKGVEEFGDPQYRDLMQNIEGQVQRVLEEEGITNEY